MTDLADPASTLDLQVLARAVFDDVLAGRREPVAIAHPLEFVCIPILRTTTFGVCGHIWHGRHSSSTVHCHSWHLHSTVIVGAVLNEVFAVVDCIDGEHQLLSVDSTGPLDRIAPTGQAVVVRDLSRTVHHAGSNYSMQAGVFHRSTPMSTGPTLTLLAATTLPGARDQIVAAHAHQQRATRREELPGRTARTLTTQFRNALDVSHPLIPAAEPAGTPQHRSRVPSPRYRPGRT